MRTAIVLVLLFPLPQPAQNPPRQQDIFDTLKDTDYALRRFQDLASRIDFQLWNVDDGTRRTQREALRAIAQNVSKTRSALSRIQRSPRPVSAADLLDASQALSGSKNELTDLTHGTLDFQISSSADVVKASEASELARASADTELTQAKLFAILMRQVLAEEAELAACRAKRSVKNAARPSSL